MSKQSHLYGKKAAFNGDSICFGANAEGGYAKILAKKYNMSCQNIAVNGASFVSGLIRVTGEPRHCICRTIHNMDADADYIILEGGVNDASITSVELGTISDHYNGNYDDTTFIGALESAFFQAYQRFPGKKIGYIAVHKMTDRFNADIPEGSFYYGALAVCNKWGIPVCDLNIALPPFRYFEEGSPLYFLREKYVPDGWHPNQAGYEYYYADKIAAWMETL